MMYCLDAKRGRIFVYNSTGDLLYTFGGLGDVFGGFKQPVSLTYGGDKLYVLDAVANHITAVSYTHLVKATISRLLWLRIPSG